ncbi:unnamed protein product [Microthlaspi erraticum]|uniref:F-box protein At3g26010-like beta-propeller domain-containing protein n=1 Tax=Microthlaspi erraticum TaxID=1685480 RepID=A0A6D2HEX8_9BRAS|nr:unnamed protein product [Microthlaspi erraticum]
MMIRYYLGNPVLPQWIQLPLPPSPPREEHSPFRDGFCDSGLVTRMHSRWSVTHVSCPGLGVSLPSTSIPISLNGKLHWLGYHGRIIVHDFFSHKAQVLAISLPANLHRARGFCKSKMISTTSQGYYVIIDAELINRYNVRVWRLKRDSRSWEKAWEVNLARVGLGCSCVPMAINFFDIHDIYLWDLEHKRFVACNLRTLAKSYGARKVGTQIDSSFENAFETVYKEDTFCLESRSLLLQFVPSLQVLPTILVGHRP